MLAVQPRLIAGKASAWAASVALALVAGVGSPGVSEAQNRYSRFTARTEPPVVRRDVKAAPPSPLLFVVSLPSQQLNVFGPDGVVLRSPVSTGTASHPTPLGVFSIIQKNRHHRSNIYSGAPMPFMQRITWSGIALHAGNLPGYPASHGCIRLPYPTAESLFGLTRLGVRVIVAPADVTPVAFAHAGLPRPMLLPAGGIEPGAVAALKSTDEATRTDAATGRLLNPVERAALIKTAAVRRSKDATLAVPVAYEKARTSAELADRISAALAEVADQRAVALRRQDEATRAAAGAVGEAAEKAKADLASAVADVEIADDALAEARAGDAEVTAAAFAAARAVRDAEAESEAAARALRDADRRSEPISVFISRKEQRLFVRQGFEEVFDAPIVIADPEQPLGTHLFLANRVTDTGDALQWIAATVPDAGADLARPQRVDRRGQPLEPQPVYRRAATAGEALARIEIPDEVRARIGERLWLGGAVIVSDRGLGPETGKGTDFVVLTK